MDISEGAGFVPRVACCICGITIDANPSNMCLNCIRSHVDIGDGLQKEYTIIYCPECDRYLQPPKYWSKADFESRELMVICLKKIKGLSKYHLADASFIWTEPHSKRLKLKLVLQREVFANTVIQQSMVIEYVIHWQQCDRCARAATGQPQWDSVVQLRQKVPHKRTFLYLEQVILRHRMHEDTTKIEAHPDGLDFYFAHKSHANSFVDFINGNVPVTRTDAVQLVSHDSKCNTAIQHHTFSLEIAPLCREDLVCLPNKLRKSLGGVGPLVLVHKLYSSIVMLDPQTLRSCELMGTLYWKSPFKPLATTKQLIEFYIVDIESTRQANGRFVLGRATVRLASDVGSGREWIVNTHLAHTLHPGDSAMGYFLEAINHNDDEFEKYDAQLMPDVILVRKYYPNQKRRRGRRNWTVKKLTIAAEGVGNMKDAAQQEADQEEFYDDIERDPEFRSDFLLYKADPKKNKKPQPVAPTAAPQAVPEEGEEEEEEAHVDVAELLDELTLGRDDDEETTPAPAEQLPPRKRSREKGPAGTDGN